MTVARTVATGDRQWRTDAAQSIVSLYALSKLGLNAQTTAFVLAYVGILVVLVQGILVGRLAKSCAFAAARLLEYTKPQKGG